MFIKNIKLLMLACFFSTSLQFILANHAADDVFKGILRENADFFTDPTQLAKSGSSSYESLIANAFSNSDATKHLPEVVFGNFKTAVVKMTIYSSPTCTHCAEYHKNVMPGLLELCRKGDLVLVTRSFVSYMKWDVTAIKISWAKGMKHQFDLMGQILAHQDLWLTLASSLYRTCKGGDVPAFAGNSSHSIPSSSCRSPAAPKLMPTLSTKRSLSPVPVAASAVASALTLHTSTSGM